MLRIPLAILLLPGLLFAQSVRPPAAHKLVVISIAGLDERFLLESTVRVKVPNIRRMIRTGAASSGVIGVTPSDTWPSASALMTGVPPAESRAATALWQAAAKKGLRTAAVDWPETSGAELAFDFPAAPESQKSNAVPFEDVARRAVPAGIADRIEKSAPGFQKPLWDDKSTAQATIYLLRNEKPDVLLVQLTDVDSEQRETAALSAYARDMLENDDELVGLILASIPQGTVVVLVSGHGFENENYIVRPRVLLKQAGQSAASVPVDVEAGLIGTADPAVAGRLRKLMADGHRHGIAREVPMADVRTRASASMWPAIAHWTAAFDTPLNYVATAEDRGPALGPGTHHGISGLWPMRPGYRSVFIIAGEGIRPQRVGEIDLLQIAPTLADIIGVELPQAKKSSLWPAISR